MNAIYANPSVRDRLADYLGAKRSRSATAAYVTQSDGCRFDRQNLRSTDDLEWFLERDVDVARSLADAESLLLHLDIEYVNFDSPLEAFVNPGRAFELQEPVVKTIETLLLDFGIRPLHLITGQGHHFVWSIPRLSRACADLAGLSPAPELLDACDARVPPRLRQQIDREVQRAFGGLGLLMEFVAHRVREAAAPLTGLPVEITAVHVGPCRSARREIISIDTSEYGDPLHTRTVRMPFTAYLKPWVTGLVRSFGPQIPAMWAIPLQEMTIEEALRVRQNEASILALARASSVRIPEQTAGTECLLSAYLASPLRRFHEHFYSVQHDPTERWPETYAQTPLDGLPVCVKCILTHPNDLLLKPAGIQIVTRSLLAEGWHARHIAGLVRSKFEDASCEWGVAWDEHEPGTRADFYVRLFAGLYATGVDKLVDMNCVSTREKGFCFQNSEMCCGLERGRQFLLSRPL